jgi:Na+-transporting NADH:ubiquinone oxidoreductase subunit F
VIDILFGIIFFTALVVLLALAVISARAFVFTSKPVTVSVNGARELPARVGLKLLGALLDDGIAVPAACGGNGTCGLCRVTVTAGGGEALPTEVAHLSRREIKKGLRLACQVTIRGDIGVRVPEEILGIEPMECVVRSARTLSPLIKEIVLDLPPEIQFKYRPGAYVLVTVPAYDICFSEMNVAAEHEPAWDQFDLRKIKIASAVPVTRAYSIANTPAERDCIVLLIRLALPPPSDITLPPGLASTYLFSVSEEDRLSVVGPHGDFGAQDSEREMVFVGGGVGMAPLRAIIFDQLERLGTKRKISFWYGARNAIDLFYVDEFDALAKRHDNFKWIAALSDPAAGDEWEGSTSFIHDVVFEDYLKRHPSPQDCEYYLCGPPLMIEAVLSMLEGVGVDDESIFNDDFGS